VLLCTEQVGWRVACCFGRAPSYSGVRSLQSRDCFVTNLLWFPVSVGSVYKDRELSLARKMVLFGTPESTSTVQETRTEYYKLSTTRILTEADSSFILIRGLTSLFSDLLSFLFNDLLFITQYTLNVLYKTINRYSPMASDGVHQSSYACTTGV
jgi:hypothetical protein